MSRINMTVVLGDSHLGRTEEICNALKELGVDVSQVLSSVGVISGSGDEDLLGSVRALEGVEEARLEHSYQLPPFCDRVAQ